MTGVGLIDSRFLVPPAGCRCCWRAWIGGVVDALDARRPSVTPPGSVVVWGWRGRAMGLRGDGKAPNAGEWSGTW